MNHFRVTGINSNNRFDVSARRLLTLARNHLNNQSLITAERGLPSPARRLASEAAAKSLELFDDTAEGFALQHRRVSSAGATLDHFVINSTGNVFGITRYLSTTSTPVSNLTDAKIDPSPKSIRLDHIDLVKRKHQNTRPAI